ALLPPPFPPDPPDPSPAFSPHLFPPLASTLPTSRSEIRRSHLSPSLSDTVMTQASDSSPTVVISETTTQLGGLAEIEFQITIPATENPTPFVTSETSNSSHSLEQLHLASTISDSNNLKIIISKHNSPLITNRASQNHALAVSTKSTHPLAECVAPPTCSPIPITLQPPLKKTIPPTPPHTLPTVPPFDSLSLPSSPLAPKSPLFAPSHATTFKSNSSTTTTKSPSNKPQKPSLKRS
ncbi:hypothetical protein HID58_043592, partial [Brassica napus]